MKLTLDDVIKDLEKEHYRRIMKETECGWKSAGQYANIGCPSDIQFISVEDEPHKGKCFSDCEECWKYVLETKWR